MSDDYYIILLAALVLDHGGEIRIPETVLSQVTKTLAITIGWDERDREVVVQAEELTPS